ncbi:MAG: GIY-YIG nuclease family protein [Bacteroidota bacterium]
MPAYCYILQSEKLSKFYVGSTTLSPELRLKNHLNGKYGNKAFSSSASDWQLFYSIECKTIDQARLIESHIKRMKSKRYILNLIKHSAITEKLKQQYSGSN